MIKILDGNRKGFWTEIETPAISGNSFAPKFTNSHNGKITVKLEGDCFKHDKVSIRGHVI